MTNELTRDINLGDRKMTVRILRVRDSSRVEHLRDEAKSAPYDNEDDQVLAEVFYPILAACTSGDVPTVEEFLNLPLDQGNAWFEAVDVLNPGLLPGMQEEETEAKK